MSEFQRNHFKNMFFLVKNIINMSVANANVPCFAQRLALFSYSHLHQVQAPYNGPLWGTFRVHRIAVGNQFPSRMHMRALWAQFHQKRLVLSSTSWRIADSVATFYSQLFSRSRDFVCSIDYFCASETEHINTQRSSFSLFIFPAPELHLYIYFYPFLSLRCFSLQFLYILLFSPLLYSSRFIMCTVFAALIKFYLCVESRNINQ